MEAGKGDALRQEQGLFCILFVAAWTKRMASGGTRPAGSSWFYKKTKNNRLTICCSQAINKIQRGPIFDTQKKQTSLTIQSEVC
jgi:hypothetical protein